MDYVNLFILMVLCHIIDDFVLQSQSLSKLKQKKWWMEECKRQGLPFNKYETDYVTALMMHAASWSAMILLPIILISPSFPYLGIIWVVNAGVHMYVDHLKANKMSISLDTDQMIHIMQIAITLYIIKVIANIYGLSS